MAGLFSQPFAFLVTGLAFFCFLYSGLRSSGLLELENGRVYFADATAEAGIRFTHQNGNSAEKLLVETFGSGVAWLDYDNDDFQDIYLVNGRELSAQKKSPGNTLLRNQGDGTFTDVTKSAGVAGNGSYGMGAAVGDYDNDGFLDLYVTNYGPNVLYRNNGDGTFRDITAEAGVAGDQWSTSAGFLDYDRDGDLDLYVVNYLDYRLDENRYCGLRREGYRSYCDPWKFDGVADHLYRNNGEGTFTEVSAEAGVFNPGGKGLGLVFADFDQDGWVDIYVTNDTTRNFVYRNSGDGKFQDLTYGSGAGYDPNGKPQAGMGVDCADVDGDGLFDIVATNFSEEHNNLSRNLGDFTFEDIVEKAGLRSGFLFLGFGTRFLDFDNDGDVDIYVANGHVVDNIHLYKSNLSYAQTDLLYENEDGRFTDVSSVSGNPFRAQKVGRGAAAADFDNDGDLDILVSNSGDRPVLMRNEGGNRNHWLLVKAAGGKSNSFGLGTKVKVITRTGSQVKEINNVSSYLSSSDIRLHFGFGAEDMIERMEIAWPSGLIQVLDDVPADQILTVREPE